MRTKEEYYDSVLKNRNIVASQANRKCSCPKVKCEWHGKCAECVALHRYHGDHLPNCFHSLLRDKVREIAKVAELLTVEKEGVPPEYWDYVRRKDKGAGK